MSKIKGLTESEVLKSREENGENIIIEKEKTTFWSEYKESFKDPMIIILLLVTALMSLLAFIGVSEWSEIIGIILSVLIVTIISTKTELNSADEYEKLKNNTEKPKAKVLREGKINEIYFNEIVKGDFIILQSGDKIPADGILVDGSIKVDNSALNGETEECSKSKTSKEYIYNDKSPLTGDTFVDKSSLFRGTIVVDGEGILKVKKIGMETMMGSMAKDMNCEEVDSPLKVKLADLANKISKFGYIGATIIGLIFIAHSIVVSGGLSSYILLGKTYIFKDILEAILLAVVIIVMAVPEGLPLMIAIVLMNNTSKMLSKNILVRKAIGIETAGSLNILFTDKTGTITKGELEVVTFFDGNITDSYNKSPIIKDFVGQAIAKNTCSMYDDNGIIIGGNSTDKALLKFLTKSEVEKYSSIDIIKSQQFNSANKYSASQLKDKVVYKGAPEKLLKKATKYINEDGNCVDIDKSQINKKIDELANRAMRVLAIAYSKSEFVENEIPDDLVIIGFVGIRDEVRTSSKNAIKRVQNAGVQVVMITGDRKETAVAIAKDSGLIKSKSDLVLTSEELNKMTDTEIKDVLKDIRVIARALPTDKSRMVKISQELNLVCGMTGDGVNDSPALKRADVGFAMGSGTEVAKEAGEIVILDDNFESIASAILYGRTIYNNILKFIMFQLTINVTAVAISAIGPFIGIEEPLSITHILWINLIMDGLGALALGSEPALDKYMDERPKSRTQSIVSKNMMTRVLFAGFWLTGLSVFFLKSNFVNNIFNSEQSLRTGYFSMFVLSVVFNGFNVRSTGLNLLEHISENKGFLKVMSAIVIIQVLITFLGGEMFSCTPLLAYEWLIVFGFAITIIPVDLFRKLVMKCK